MVPSAELVLIDFRYHIVSIAAVFLALGIGVATGAAVLDRVTVGQLESQLNTLRDQLNDHRAEVTELRAERARSNDIIEDLAERATEGLLDDTSLVFVTEGQEEQWHSGVREALQEAGGVVAASVVLSERWLLQEEDEIQELRQILDLADQEDQDEEADLAGEAGESLGGLLAGPLDSPVLVSLEESGFLTLVADQEGPGERRAVVVLASSGSGILGAVTHGVAEEAPTLAVAQSIEELGELSELRSDASTTPLLSTFDSAATDPSGVGMVLALEAALGGRGGHFGEADGLSYAAPRAS